MVRCGARTWRAGYGGSKRAGVGGDNWAEAAGLAGLIYPGGRACAAGWECAAGRLSHDGEFYLAKTEREAAKWPIRSEL